MDEDCSKEAVDLVVSTAITAIASSVTGTRQTPGTV